MRSRVGLVLALCALMTVIPDHRRRVGIAFPSPSVIIGDGDSLMDSGGVSIWSDTFPGQLSITRSMGYSAQNSVIVAGTPSTYLVNNWGIGGQDVVNMKANAATNIDPLFITNAYLMAWCATNDFALGGRTEAAVYADLVTYHTARRAVGFRTAVLTTLSRGDVNIDTQRAALNTDLRNNWHTFADFFIDLDTIAQIGYNGAWADTTYFAADKIHLIAAGYALVKTLVHTTFPA